MNELSIMEWPLLLYDSSNPFPENQRHPAANFTNQRDGLTLPAIWIYFPYRLKRKFAIENKNKKVSRHGFLMHAHANFPPLVIYNNTYSHSYFNLRDNTRKELQSSVVYKFIFPGCKPL